MGQGTSSSTSTTGHPFPKIALHCLRVAEHSPAHTAGIQPFFDYLVGVDLLHRQSSKSNGASGSGSGAGLEDEVYEEPVGMNLDPEELARILDENEGKEIGLRVYNAKSQRTRYVTLTPSRIWSSPSSSHLSNPSQPSSSSSTSNNQQPLRPSLLGLSMRLCDPAEALGQVWHILEVLEGSPAESAGLVPYGDYIVGWTEGPLQMESDFYELVEEYEDKPLRLYVYSSDLDNLREIVLVPNRQWGGEGLLGCGVGYGLLHRIPLPQTTTTTLPTTLSTSTRPTNTKTKSSTSSASTPKMGLTGLTSEGGSGSGRGSLEGYFAGAGRGNGLAGGQ